MPQSFSKDAAYPLAVRSPLEPGRTKWVAQVCPLAAKRRDFRWLQGMELDQKDGPGEPFNLPPAGKVIF